MKKSRHVMLMLVLGGVAAVTGCQTEVAGNREGVPAPMAEPVPGIENEVSATPAVTDKPKVTPTTPVANQVPEEPVSVIPPFDLSPVPQTIYTVKKGDSLWLIAHAHGVSVGELLVQNPKLAQKSVLKVGEKVSIPAGGAYIPPEKRPHVKPMPMKKVTRKTTSSKVKTVSAASTAAAAGGTYTVVSGDFPERIARKHKIKTKALLDANNLNEKSVLQVGQKLVIPGGSAVVHAAPASNTASVPAANVNNGQPVVTPPPAAGNTTAVDAVPAPLTPPVAAPAPANDPGRTIQANAGETLRSISVDFFLSLDELKRLNPGVAEDQPLTEGTVVKIPQS